LPSAQERYVKEIKRITKVLNVALEDKQFLVGNKCTFADLSFVPWYWAVEGLEPVSPGLLSGLKEENPNFKAWIERLNGRPSVVKAVAVRKEKMTLAKE
jgi:glutathione S-transferase